MKKISWNNLVASIKKTSPGLYLRELSVVIIGVMITLFFTNMISSNSKQNEVKESLKLMSLELQENLKDIRNIETWVNREKRIYSLLLENLDDLSRIPRDTLEKNRIVVGGTNSIINRQDAYEVFKSSSLMQYVEDKEFLQTLTNTYKFIDAATESIDSYMQQKVDAIERLMDDMPKEDVKLFMSNDVYAYFSIAYSHKNMQLFLYSSMGVFDADLFDDCYNKINTALDTINKKL